MYLKEFKATYEVENFFAKNEYSSIFWDIIKIIRIKNKGNYKRSTDERAERSFIQIWNDLLHQDNLNFTLKSAGIIWVLISNLMQELKGKE
jgi:hypothetical protein